MDSAASAPPSPRHHQVSNLLLSAKSRACDASKPPPFSRKLILIISSNFATSRRKRQFHIATMSISCTPCRRRHTATRHQHGPLKDKESIRQLSSGNGTWRKAKVARVSDRTDRDQTKQMIGLCASAVRCMAKENLVAPTRQSAMQQALAPLLRRGAGGLTTLDHLSVSCAMILPKSSGVPGINVPPSSASFACTPGSASASFTVLFSLSMIGRGVPIGTAMPNHALAS